MQVFFQCKTRVTQSLMKTGKGTGPVNLRACVCVCVLFLSLFAFVFVFVFVKGIYPAPDIHEHFTIHKWLRNNAYIFTHNFNNLEHIVNNCMNTTMHTDVNTA